MLTGSSQGPSDPETMVMGLNKNKSAYIEWWKPLEEVKEVYLRRFADRVAAEMAWHYPKKEYYYKLLDFMNHKCSWEDVGVEGSKEEIIALGYKLLIEIDEVVDFEKWIEKTASKIKNANTQQEIVDIYDNWVLSDEDAIDDICEDCIDFRIAFASNHLEGGALRSRATLNGIWGLLGRECATDEFDRIVRIFGIEDDSEDETPFTGTLGDNLLMCRQDFGMRIGADVKDKTALDVMNEVVHGFWMPVDRSEALKTPGLKMVGPPIPDATGFNKTLEDCMLEEAQRIWDTGRQLRVYWSGGIDSTGVLVALMRTAKGDDLDRLTVCYTTNENLAVGWPMGYDRDLEQISNRIEYSQQWKKIHVESSVEEYELFFNKFIDGKLNKECILPAEPSKFYSKGTSWIISNGTVKHLADSARDGYLVVTGELGDQLFGSAAFGNDDDMINMTSKEYLESDVGRWKAQENQKYIDDIKKINEACPIGTENLTDMLWWWNFAIKWCEVKFRSSLAVEHGSHLKNINHFYDNEDFQKWSISNPDKKIKKTQQSYKWLLKDFIYDYTKDADYRDNKVKLGSIGVRIGDIAAIDDNYNIIKFGKISSFNSKMKQRYGETLSKFVRNK